jgi:FMNH2-dependent dimethyl sulfone monooxygenase
LNVVGGFSSETDQIGKVLLPYDERYRQTEDYISILKGRRTAEPGSFSRRSEFYTIEKGFVSPLPMQQPHPPIANAGVSEAAREMTTRLCDWALIGAQSPDDSGAGAPDFKGRAISINEPSNLSLNRSYCGARPSARRSKSVAIARPDGPQRGREFRARHGH